MHAMSRRRALPLAFALATLATLATLASLAACDQRELGGSLARIQERKEITWGADLQGGEPYLWLDDGGHLVGFEVEIMDAIARRLGAREQRIKIVG